MKYYRYTDKADEFQDLNIQLVATEMDTSAQYLQVVSERFMKDAIERDCFDKLYKNIRANGVEIVAFDDHTVMMDFDDQVIVLRKTIENRYIIFDANIKEGLEDVFNSYK